MSYVWTFLAGMGFMVFSAWVTSIPYMRRHRVVMALLERAKMYQQRAKKLAEAGKEEEAMAAYREYSTAIAQAEELHKRNTRKKL
jgi:hypothetical protein